MTTTSRTEPKAKTTRIKNNLRTKFSTASDVGDHYTLRKRKATTTTTAAKRSIVKKKTTAISNGGKQRKRVIQTYAAKDTDVLTIKSYPKLQHERMKYINPKSMRTVTPFQFKVYDLVAQIPAGEVTSYKILSDLLKSSPRAVGQALRLNPFCPLPVPCHRVIATDYSIGGFAGGSGDHQNTADKKAKLQAEGCVFGEHYDFKHDKYGTTKFFSNFVL